jgi:hypothetical protein
MTATLTLTVTLEEAHVLAQALDLLASDPSLISDEWPNVEEDNPQLAALGLAAFDLSSRVHDAIDLCRPQSDASGERTPQHNALPCRFSL